MRLEKVEEILYLTEVLDGALEGMESNIHFIMRPQIRHILAGVCEEARRKPRFVVVTGKGMQSYRIDPSTLN